jgi:hypothetical protein
MSGEIKVYKNDECNINRDDILAELKQLAEDQRNEYNQYVAVVDIEQATGIPRQRLMRHAETLGIKVKQILVDGKIKNCVSPDDARRLVKGV